MLSKDVAHCYLSPQHPTTLASCFSDGKLTSCFRFEFCRFKSQSVSTINHVFLNSAFRRFSRQLVTTFLVIDASKHSRCRTTRAQEVEKRAKQAWVSWAALGYGWASFALCVGPLHLACPSGASSIQRSVSYLFLVSCRCIAQLPKYNTAPAQRTASITSLFLVRTRIL